MKNIVKYDYVINNNTYSISFLHGTNNQMINATEMAKPFNKQPTHWLGLLSTKEYIKTFAELKNRSSADLVVVRKGGNDKHLQGTWMHEDIALEFARWLSPKLSIWCNDRIKELLRDGYSYLVTTSRNEIYDNLYHDIQKKNSKAIARKNYGLERDQRKVIQHYREIMFLYVGMYPNQIVSWAKKNGIPATVINKGSREILRYIESTIPACISLVENIVSTNPNYDKKQLTDLVDKSLKLMPFFNEMIEIGYWDKNELKKIREYENFKNSLNEKN